MNPYVRSTRAAIAYHAGRRGATPYRVSVADAAAMSHELCQWVTPWLRTVAACRRLRLSGHAAAVPLIHTTVSAVAG